MSAEKMLHVGQLNLPAVEEFREAFEGIFERRFFANHGPLERELDTALAAYFGVKHAIAVVNGTAALMLALQALGVRGEVIAPSFTFPATCQSIVWAGLEPVLCDVDARTHMMAAPLVRAKITDRTVAIMGFHAWGKRCEPRELEELARRRGLKLLFDAAHAGGCTFEGRRIGGLGDAEAFSLCAEHVRQLEGESPFDNLMEVKS
jgi:dTDP-4-amino-4,6-dideoxygalactose transaminase